MNNDLLDSKYAVPRMPLHVPGESMMLWATIIMSTVTLSLFIWWFLSKERREHGYILPLCLIGGSLSALQEPILDVLVLFWYPVSDHLVAFHAFGRDVPLFVVIGYAWYCGGLPYLFYRMIGNGVSRRQLWRLFWVFMAVDCLGISVPVLMGVCGFYGNQPFNIWGYPFWWAGLDAAHPVLGGLVLFWLIPKIHQRWARGLAILFTPSYLLGGVSGAAIWPIALALNIGLPTPFMYLAGAATFALGTVLVAAAIYLCGLVSPCPRRNYEASPERKLAGV